MKIELSSRVYPLEAILNACYAFIERAYIFLDTDTKRDSVAVSFKGKSRISKKQFEALKGEFINELLHCALRYEISKNNRKIREYIIGRALFSVSPVLDPDSTVDKLNYQDDPLGIAIPWEEKHGKKKKNAKKHKV